MSRHAEESVPDRTAAPARPPVAAPAATPVGVLIALLLIAAGVVAVREMLLSANAISGPSWVLNTAAWVDRLPPAAWLIPAGIGAILVGLWWLISALKPRRRTELRMADEHDLWMRRADISRIAHATADSVAGTTSASARTGRRRVTVTVTTTEAEAPELRTAVSDAVRDRLAPLERTFAVKVKTKLTHDGSER